MIGQMISKSVQRAKRCSDDFRAMTNSIERTAKVLRSRFAVEVVLTAGRTLPLLDSNALDEKFHEYLRRAQGKEFRRELEHGHKHSDYPSFLPSLSPADRPPRRVDCRFKERVDRRPRHDRIAEASRRRCGAQEAGPPGCADHR